MEWISELLFDVLIADLEGALDIRERKNMVSKRVNLQVRRAAPFCRVLKALDAKQSRPQPLRRVGPGGKAARWREGQSKVARVGKLVRM